MFVIDALKMDLILKPDWHIGRQTGWQTDTIANRPTGRPKGIHTIVCVKAGIQTILCETQYLSLYIDVMTFNT